MVGDELMRRNFVFFLVLKGNDVIYSIFHVLIRLDYGEIDLNITKK